MGRVFAVSLSSAAGQWSASPAPHIAGGWPRPGGGDPYRGRRPHSTGYTGDIPLKGRHEAEGISMVSLQCLRWVSPVGEQKLVQWQAYGANMGSLPPPSHRAVGGRRWRKQYQRGGCFVDNNRPDWASSSGCPRSAHHRLAVRCMPPVLSLKAIDTEACNAFHDVLLQDIRPESWTLPGAQSTRYPGHRGCGCRHLQLDPRWWGLEQGVAHDGSSVAVQAGPPRPPERRASRT